MVRFVNITQDEFLRQRILYKHIPFENNSKVIFMWKL